LTIGKLRESLLRDVAEKAGGVAEAKAIALLDYVQAIMSPEQASDIMIFQDQLVSRSVPYIQKSPDGSEKHFRLLGVSHLLANLLRPAVESNEDDYITTRYEELTDRLACLERVEETNPSLDNRLLVIYQGLVELASALGLTACDALCFLKGN
jgi:hypothetical protein